MTTRPGPKNVQVADRVAAASLQAWDRPKDRRAVALLFLVVWVIYLGTASYGVNQVNDTRATALMAWSLGTHGTVDLPAEWRGEIPWQAEGLDGRLLTDRFPGAWLWAAPFHAVAGLFGGDEIPGHPAFINHAPSGVAAATATALGVCVSFLLFRRLAKRRDALVAAGVLAFATGVWSVSADAMWTHGLTHLALSLGLLLSASGRHAQGGLAFGFSVLTRPQTAVIPLVVGLWRGADRRSLKPVVVVGLASGLGVVAMLAYSRLMFGTWVPIGAYAPEKVESVASVPFSEFGRRVVGGLLHPSRGILIYTPFVVVLLRFVPAGWRVAPWWTKAGAVSGVLYLIVQFRSNGYDGGSSFFGARLGLETLVLASPLLLVAWQERVQDSGTWRRLTSALIVVAFAMHAVGATYLSAPPGRDRAWQQHIARICDAPSPPQGCASSG